jgi:hypothetical protein
MCGRAGVRGFVRMPWTTPLRGDLPVTGEARTGYRVWLAGGGDQYGYVVCRALKACDKRRAEALGLTAPPKRVHSSP